jgi:hypothetical protein
MARLADLTRLVKVTVSGPVNWWCANVNDY